MNQQRIDLLKKQYLFEDWHGRTALEENLFIWKFFLSGNELSGWKMQRMQQLEAGEGAPFLQSMWQRLEGGLETLLSLEIVECASRAAAHEYMLQLLNQFQSPLMRREEASPVGDVAFVHPGEQTILFARANLVLMLRNAGPQVVTVTGTAGELDLDLIARPAPSDDAAAPRIEKFDSPARQLQVGKTLPLELQAADPLGRPLWFKFFSRSGEILVDEQGLAYRAASPGAQDITAFAINANRGAARRELRLTVNE